MALQTHKTASGYLLPSIHSAPPFFTQQPNPTTQATLTEQWIRLILSYARHRRLFFLRVEDVEASSSDWDEVLKNDRIHRRIPSSYLSYLLETMVSKEQATYEPPKQSRAVLLFWRTPEDWGEILHQWVTSTGQLNTIMTFYEITSPPIESSLSGLPVPLLRKAIINLTKTGRAQIIGVSEGEGVRFFPGTSK